MPNLFTFNMGQDQNIMSCLLLAEVAHLTNRSILENTLLPVPGGKGRYRSIDLFFEPSSWEKSDIFVPEGTGFTIVTEEVKTAIQNLKPINIRFDCITEVENMDE